MSRNLGWFSHLWRRHAQSRQRLKQPRSSSVERLERRDLLAAAIWHNPVFPLDVTGDEPARVSALDALQIINWLNDPSLPRQLPRQVETSTQGRFVDTTCDGRVSALDALRVINHLNSVGSGVVGGFFTDGGSYAGAACSPQLLEGTGFATQLDRVLKIPENRPALEVTFQAPEFDTLARQQIRDAFEIQIVQADGSPLSNPISPGRTAAFNWTEGYQPVSASGMWMDIAAPGQDSKVTIDLSEFPVDTEIRVLARLVNNDSDDNTSVIIRGYEFVALPSTPPSVGSGVLAESLRLPVSEFDIRRLSDLTGLFELDYGRTSLSTDKLHLVTQAELTNRSNSAVLSPLIAVFENFSDPNVFLVRPDGFLQDGRPFFDLSGSIHASALASGQSIVGPSLRFRNDSGQRFDYRLSVFGRVNPGPAGFSSQPITSIEAGKLYRYDAQAQPTLDSPLSYRVVSGPEELTIDPETGRLQWQTQSSDVGSHQITLRATDEFGMFTEQTFELQVLEVLTNRPPVFVSTPDTEAVAAGAFDVITLPTGSMPAGLAVGNFGVHGGATSINELSLVAINQGSQTLSLISGMGRDGAGREVYGPTQSLSVGEPPISGNLLRTALDIDVGLPPLGNTLYDSNRILGLAQGDFNGDGILDVATSIVYQYRSPAVTDHYERRIAITLGRGDGTFEAPIHFAVPGPVAFTWDNIGAIALQAKDFDLDGKLDLLVSETKGKKLLFYKGLGDGNFLAASQQSTGTDISGYKVADLNGDGILDLIAMRADSGAFGVLLGNGDGTFQAYAEFSTHTGYTVNHNFAIGELNGDGLVDFVSGNHATRMLNVYLGNGDGTFTRGVDLASRGTFSDNPAVLDWSMALVIGDFSGNGHADIAYTTYSNSGFGVGSGGGIALYEGDGNGATFTWSTAVNVAMSQTPQNIHGDAQPVDLNGDGHLDLVFTGPGEWGNYAPGVNVALNDGTGRFTSTFWIDSNMGTHPQPSNLNNGLGVLVGDFNNDGMLDLLTARNGRQHTGNQFSSVSLMLADTPGTYRAAYDVRASSAMWGTVSLVEYADFNNDGILDLWGPAYQNPSFTQLGNGDGTFQQPITATPWIGNEGLGKGFAADLDLDGNMDVVWSGQGGIQGGPQGRYLAALGNGDGTFRITYAQTGNNTPSGYAPLVIKPADFDGDGYLDFVALTGLNTIEIMRNVPEVPGTFTRSYSVPFGAATLRPSLNVGDFDGDGVPDVIAVREQSNRVHDLLFYKGNGDGTLAQPTLVPFAPDTTDFRFPKHIAVGDLNSDGNLDLVINASYHRSAVVLGNGDGTFQPPMAYRTGTIFGDRGGLHLIDLNNDGNLDMVSMDDTVSQRTLEVRLGLGDGTFGKAQLWGTSEGTGQLTFGDLDNDGRIDVGVNGDSRQEAVATFLGNRQGLSGVLATDINGDDRTDILAINHDNSHVKRLISDGRGNFTRLHDLLVGAGPVDLLSGDFGGNGRTDFLTINRSGRSISVMLADGLGGYSRTDVPVGQLPVAGALGKVTGGQHDDLLVIDAQRNALFVLTQDGSGGFAESAMIPLGDKPTAIAVGHIDGDSTTDVIISLAETNRLMILRSLGASQFTDPTYVNLPTKPGKLAAGDLNGDGLLDLAVTFPETSEVALLFGMGQSRFTQPQLIRVGSQPDSIVMADANGDGLLDVLVTNAGDDTASVILNRFDPNQLYRYDALAIDPEDDPVTYSILEGPGGMILDADTGEVRWAPMAEQIGVQRVVLESNDGRGGRATQEFSISVEAARTNAAPVITTLPKENFAADQRFTTSVSATDPDGDRLRYRLVDGPEGATLDPVTGQLDWDPRGTALQMNRVAQAGGFVQLPHTAAQNFDSMTVEGWFRFAKTSGTQVLAQKSLNWASPAFFTLWYNVGSLQLFIGDGTSQGVEALSIVREVPTEEWIHLSASFDDATGEMALQINGVQVASKITSKRIGTAGDNIPLRISQDVYPFHGDVFGFRMWNVARSESQLKDGMHQLMASDTPNLIVDLRFNEGDSLSVLNHANRSHHGIVSGTVVPKRIVGMTPVQSAQFTVGVEDGKGGFDRQTFTVTVAPKQPGSIEGTLFSDDNRDGSQQAGETPLAGWTVFIDHNSNGYRDADEAFSVTDASGKYRFNQLLQGDYNLAVELQSGFASPAAREVSVVTQQVTTSDIATQPLPRGQVRGRVTQATTLQPLAHQQVFADLNRNGLWDEGEPSTTTDTQGRYALGGLAAGDYLLRMQTQAAWQVSQPANSAHDVVLSSDDLLDDLDFVVQPSSALAAAIPQVITAPPRTAAVGQPYRYSVAANSRDGRAIVYGLSLAPDGMAIDARTGQIAWKPNGKQTGSQQVIVRASTDDSHVDLQAFFIEVAPANSAPMVTSTPASPASVGRLWSYPVMAQDAEQLELSYSLSVAPDGATIESNLGLVTWTPLASQIGAHAFTVLVSDNAGGVTHHSFTLDVVSDASSTLPFLIQPPRADASLLTRYLSRVSGVDNLGQPLTVELLDAPAGLTLDASGFIEWSPTFAQLGSQSLTVRFSSPGGSSQEHSFAFSVRQTILNSAPQIQSTPGSLFAVAGQLYAYDLAVGDADNDALSFELLTAPAGMSIHPQLGTLRWLPTLDQLGQSNINVRVTDPQGGSDIQSFILTTRRLGGPPLIQSVPPTQAAVGIGYLYTVMAIDAENDPLTYSLIDAPNGMTIDSRTGEVAWTPTAEQLGQQSVFIAVSDASGNRSTQGFAIEVAAGLPNRPPLISNQPHLFATVGQVYSSTIQATDPEGSVVTYSLRRGPEGMALNPTTGQVSWTPAAGQAGRAVVTLVASDAQGGASVQSFEIDVLGVNTPPVIISTPPAFAWASGMFQYDIFARDIDRDPIQYQLLGTMPGGMTMDTLGRIRWQTQANDVGSYSITVRASDPRGGQATQQIDFEVRADNVPPKVTLLPRGGGWPWDGPVVVLVSAVDNVGVVDVELRVNGQLVPLDVNRTARLYFDDWGSGVLNMVAIARDAAGNEATGTGTAFYRDPEVDYESGEGLPVATITSPSEDGTVFGMVQIIGTAIGGTAAATGFKEYRLSYGQLDQLQFTEFVHSTTPVADGLLGVWDTTLLENDAYVLRLEVVSEAGNTSVYETNVGLSGNLKLGNFRLSFDDLSVPVAGLPITVSRTYDTLQAERDGDFGYGWRMEYRETALRVNLPKSGLEDLGIYTPYRSGTKIFMTLPGGQRVSWTFTPELRVLPGWGQSSSLVVASPRYTPDRGNTATLTAGSGWLTVNEFGDLYAAAGIPWNPASPDFGGGFTVTTAEGVRMHIDGNSGDLQSITQLDGNTLTFTDNTISTSTGDQEVRFVRDYLGRIVQIIDPLGNSIQYGYSSSGDLTTVTDREGHTTTYRYHSTRPHYMVEIIDPLARPIARTDYDADGRLIGLVDGANSMTFAYDPENSVLRSTNALGETTAIEYDGLGNIVGVVNPLGARTRSAYDDFGNEVQFIDPLGRTTQRVFDSSGKLLEETDPLGNKTHLAYDRWGNVLSMIDPLGNVSTFTYDSVGNPRTISDALGFSFSANYAANGTETYFMPNGVSITSQDAGSSATSTTPHGAQNFVEFDAARNVIRSIVTYNGTQAVSSNVYDQNGRPILKSNALGQESRIEYDVVGNVTAVVDPLGRRTTTVYNAFGQVASVQHVDGTVESWEYDQLGRVIAQVDREGRTTRYTYDAAGNLIATMLPDDTPSDDSDNPVYLTQFNLAGEVTAEVDPLGRRTEYAYDLAGRLNTIRFADGSTTSYVYDASGRRLVAEDELGRHTRWEYNANGQVTATIAPDGSRTESEYNALGRLSRQRDSLGQVTTFEYTPGGLLSAVVDPMGHRTTHVYDELGRRTGTTDATGLSTQFEYDLLGQLISVVLPSGARSESVYDAGGRLTGYTNFDQNAITIEFDDLTRTRRETYSDGAVIVANFSPEGNLLSQSLNADVVQFSYTARNKLRSRTSPDGTILSYGYDLVDNIVSITTPHGQTQSEYDHRNRRVQVEDSDLGVTRYHYSANGLLIQTDLPNSTTESRSYSLNGQLMQLQVVDAQGSILSQIEYEYDAAGNRTTLRKGNQENRYFYDASNRLVSEQHFELGAIHREISYSYDAVGNRLQRVDSAEGTTLYTYDLLHQLTDEQNDDQSTQKTYDGAGRLVMERQGPDQYTQYHWNSRSQLARVTRINGVHSTSRDYVYDPAGELFAVVDGSDERRYLVDVNRTHAEVLEEYSPGGILIARQVYGRQRIAETNSQGTFFYLTDAIGSVIGLAGTNGEPISRYDYDAFGGVIASEGIQLDSGNLFAGERRDSISGLDHLRLRHYDSRTGRFVSRDPVIGIPELGQSYNPYSYAFNDPVNLTDPSGASPLMQQLQALAVQSTLFTARFKTGIKVVRFLGEVAFWYKVSSGFNLLLHSGVGGFYDAGAAKASYTVLKVSSPIAFFNEFKVDLGLSKGSQILSLGLTRKLDQKKSLKVGGTLNLTKFQHDPTRAAVEFMMSLNGGMNYTLVELPKVFGVSTFKLDLYGRISVPQHWEAKSGSVTNHHFSSLVSGLEATIGPSLKFTVEVAPGLFLALLGYKKTSALAD
jgi:large repetitive protein